MNQIKGVLVPPAYQICLKVRSPLLLSSSDLGLKVNKVPQLLSYLRSSSLMTLPHLQIVLDLHKHPQSGHITHIIAKTSLILVLSIPVSEWTLHKANPRQELAALIIPAV